MHAEGAPLPPFEQPYYVLRPGEYFPATLPNLKRIRRESSPQRIESKRHYEPTLAELIDAQRSDLALDRERMAYERRSVLTKRGWRQR